MCIAATQQVIQLYCFKPWKHFSQEVENYLSFIGKMIAENRNTNNIEKHIKPDPSCKTQVKI